MNGKKGKNTFGQWEVNCSLRQEATSTLSMAWTYWESPPHATSSFSTQKKVALFLPGDSLPSVVEDSSLVRLTSGTSTQPTQPEPILKGKG